MPTVPQIIAAKTQLEPQPYADDSMLSADAVATLHIFLKKYLQEHNKTGRYGEIQEKLATAVGINAAQLQAVLNNVSEVGSKKAKLNGEVEYTTQETIDNELAFAVMVMYDPVAMATMGSKPSDIATAIRKEFTLNGCYGDEYQQTRCKDLR